jgi:hypothetical protein
MLSIKVKNMKTGSTRSYSISTSDKKIILVSPIQDYKIDIRCIDDQGIKNIVTSVTRLLFNGEKLDIDAPELYSPGFDNNSNLKTEFLLNDSNLMFPRGLSIKTEILNIFMYRYDGTPRKKYQIEFQVQ